MVTQVKKFIRSLMPQPMLDRFLQYRARRLDRVRGYPRFMKPSEITSSPAPAGEKATGANDPLGAFFNLVRGFDHRNLTALDRAHNLLLVGTVLAMKPKNVLELGVGTGYVSTSLILALRYNGGGKLTSVDNWYDTQGVEPALAGELRKEGVNVITSGEGEFLRAAATDAYDLVVSDADHLKSHEWFDEYFRTVPSGGIIFFHDTNQPQVFPELSQFEARIAQRGLSYHHFKQSSRPDEHCERGWLMVINRK